MSQVDQLHDETRQFHQAYIVFYDTNILLVRKFQYNCNISNRFL